MTFGAAASTMRAEAKAECRKQANRGTKSRCVVEGVGSEPGTVEVIDLSTMKNVARVDLPPQAAGIDFWKME